MMFKLLQFALLIHFTASEVDFLLGLAEKHGYVGELHNFETSDGYILGVHRIYNKTFASMSKEIVFFVHGLIMSAPCYGLGGKFSQIHLLADKGFDVWLFNSRGNKVSEKHSSLTVEDPAYWNYSWHEIGAIDVPQTIDYVLNMTKRSNLNYVGHSQGCAVFAVMLSLLPEYNGKIKSAFLLAPAIYISHATSITKLIVRPNIRRILTEISQLGNIYALRMKTKLGKNLIKLALQFPGTSIYLHLAIGPPSGNEADPKLREIMAYNLLDASSVKQFIHFGQSMDSGIFQQFNYERENVAIYGKSEPPRYDLSMVRVPVNVVYGGNDALVTPVDVKRMIKEMGKNVVNEYFYKNWHHVDFIYPVNTINELFPKMLKFYRKNK